MKHEDHQMHEHSLLAFDEEHQNLSARESMILRDILERGPGTDRQIMTRLGFSDPNAVRPRITELCKKGLLTEVGARQDFITGKTVRIVGEAGSRFFKQEELNL